MRRQIYQKPNGERTSTHMLSGQQSVVMRPRSRR